MPVCLSLHLVGHLKNKSSACCSAKDKMIFTRRCTSGARCHAWPERNLSLERGGDGGGDVTHRCIQPKNIHLAVTAAPPATSSSSQLQHQQQQAPKLWLFFLLLLAAVHRHRRHHYTFFGNRKSLCMRERAHLRNYFLI